MSPFMSIEEELAEEERVLRAEQEWFLSSQVQPSLEAIQKALIACQDAAKLQDDTKGALTLAISSTNNDILKGFVTLSSSFIIKGAGVVESNQPLPKDIKESTRPLKTLLELLQRHLRAGIEAMAQPNKENLYPFRVCDPKIFSPALSEDFVIEFYIRDSQLVCAAYALQLTGGSSSGSNGGHSGPSLSTFLHQTPLQTPPAPSSTEAATGTFFSSMTTPHNRNSSTDANQTSSGPHVHFPQQPAQVAYGQIPSLASLSTTVATGDQHQPTPKGGHITPRPASPVTQHSHHQYQPPQPILKPYSWSPSRSPPTPPQPLHSGEYHSSSNVASVSVVLPASSKVGQTGKGGINKYRGKVATTLEDKMIQVQSSKLSEISSKLSAAEGLCRRLLHFLVLQESVVSSNGV
ncbi:MAG: hypothetical protein BYD32DRAFT_171405 [Podila humilis]|nr:MAG: hypothetical protein BYD32DRAFT_171405 [Podila humilis]